MIGVLLFINSRGDIVLSRAFRDGLSIRDLADTFKHSIVIPKRSDRCPINIIDRVAYLHLRCNNIYIVACANANVNCILVFQYIERLLSIFMSYFSAVTELSLKENFVNIQKIIDETLDFGYPQFTEVDVLKSYITTGGSKKDIVKKPAAAEAITVKASGKIPWRKEGIVYRVNEAYLQVVEEVNLLMSKDGETLQRDVVGCIVFKSFLSGMPECQIVLNDKMMIEAAHYAAASSSTNNNNSNNNSNTPKLTGDVGDDVEFDDVTFHPCVRLTIFDKNRSICFIPPDGECTLMKYRTSGNIAPPIRLLMSRIKEVSSTRMEIDFTLKTEFPTGVTVKDCTVSIPCPENTANVSIRIKMGKAKYDPSAQAIVWKHKSLLGREEIQFSAEVTLIPATIQTSNMKVWIRPPLTLKFLALQYACSGIKVERLTIAEPTLNYNAKKWVKYLTTGGQYQCRL